MTPADFSATLEKLGWSIREVARRLECNHHMPVRWSTGEAEIPYSVERWITTLATLIESHPAPSDWRSKRFHRD